MSFGDAYLENQKKDCAYVTIQKSWNGFPKACVDSVPPPIASGTAQKRMVVPHEDL